MPESVKDRCTKSHEYIFLLSKSKNYYYNNDAIKRTSLKIGELEIDQKANITMRVQVYHLILVSLNHIQRRINVVYGV